MSFSGYGAACVGVVIGFVVSAVSAAVVPRRRRLGYGLLGNACTIVAWFLSTSIRSWRSGFDVVPEMPAFLAAATALIIIPGLLGVAVVMAIDWASRPPP